MDMIQRSWYHKILETKRQSENSRNFCGFRTFCFLSLIKGYLI